MNRDTHKAAKAVTMSDKRIKQVIEQQVTAGAAMVIEDVGEELDPMLAPVVETHLAKKTGGGWLLLFNEKELNFVPGFSVRTHCVAVFCTFHNARCTACVDNETVESDIQSGDVWSHSHCELHFGSQGTPLLIFIFSTVLSCARQGLEDQLLARVILHERESLELQRKRLIEEATGIRKKISELEEVRRPC